MANEKNLIPFSERSESEARENGRKGGIASGAARRRKRSLKEAVDLFASLPVADAKVKNRIVRAGVSPEEADNQMSMVVGLFGKASKGDAKAAKLLIDLLADDSGSADDPLDDGFVDALRGEAEEVWQEE